MRITLSTAVGRYLLDRLYEYGVTDVFGVPGDYVLRFDKVIEEHPIRFINATRESTAGIMAEAYARRKGLGAACVTFGVGLGILNPTAQAFVENTPLVIISGAAGKEEFHRNPLLHHLINKTVSHDRDYTQLELFKQVTVAQTVLEDPQTALSEIDRVLAACLQHKKPVYIEIPRDLVDVEAPVHTIPLHMTEYPSDGLEEALEETVKRLSSCHSPLLWIGKEIATWKLTAPILAFAEAHHIPIVSTLLGKGTIDEHHPLFAGVYQGAVSNESVSTLFEKSDFILMLGVLRTDVDTGFNTVSIDPDHRLIASARRVTLGHHEFTHLSFVPFIEALPSLSFNRTFLHPLFDKPLSSFHPQPIPITTKRLFEAIQSHIQKEHVLIADIGDSLFGSSELFVHQNNFHASAYFAAMGYAIPASLGAQIASPTIRPICLVGDGAFQMNATELSTALRYHLDPVIIILNNHGYTTERPLIEGAFNDITNWNYSELPRLLGGGTGFKVTTETGLEEALQTALTSRGALFLIEVELKPDDYSPALLRFKTLAQKTT